MKLQQRAAPQRTPEQQAALAEYWHRVKSVSMEQVLTATTAPPPATHQQLLSLSRLTTTEQTMSFSSLRTHSADANGEIAVLRQAAKRLVKHPSGWWMVVGPPGNAKSLILSIIVAESCRAGRAARYYNASEIDRATKPPLPYEDGGQHVIGNPDAFKAMAKRLPVLAIDECDKLSWTPWQVQHIGEILEDRYRNQHNRLTVFAANLPPHQWSNADHLWHLISRFNDGRFRMIWHGDKVPRALSQYVDNGRHFIPAIFNLTLADVRASLPAREV